MKVGVNSRCELTCVASKRGVNCILSQHSAVDMICRDSWDGPDHVGRVDVLQVNRISRLIEMSFDLTGQIFANVGQNWISTSVCLTHP